MKVGLVLEGGAMRGVYTSGVLDVFMDNKLKFDEIIGVSAGALFGVNFLSKQRGRGIRYNKKYCSSRKYMGFKSFITTGNVINKNFAYYEVPTKLDVFDNDTYKKNKDTKFYATATNVETGKAEYIRVTDPMAQMELLRSTAAMPFVSKMVEYKGKKYLDGAVADAIPVEKIRSMKCDKVVVVLTRPIEYRKKNSKNIFNKLFYSKYPNLVESLNVKSDNYNREVEYIIDAESKKEIFVIRPSRLVKVNRIERNPDTLQEMYDLGVSDATSKMKELKKYLKK